MGEKGEGGEEDCFRQDPPTDAPLCNLQRQSMAAQRDTHAKEEEIRDLRNQVSRLQAQLEVCGRGGGVGG